MLLRLEYLTIVGIIVVMTVWDFVIGVLFGIVMSCAYRFQPDLIGSDYVVSRFLLRYTEFPTEEYSCHPYRRYRHVDCS